MELYAMQSKPWYTGILIYGIFAVVVLLVGIALKFMIHRSIKENSKGEGKHEISQSSRAPLYALRISFCRSERYVL